MEISVLHSISWAYEAPRLLQLLQDVCTSCAACAAALERAAAVISHLIYAFCSHGSSHAGMCCSWMSCLHARACDTCSPHMAGLDRLARLAADGLHGGQGMWSEAWEPLEQHGEPIAA